MALGIARATVDWSTRHTGPGDHIAPEQTHYKPKGGATVFVNGQPAITVDDLTDCDDKAKEGSGTVFIGGKAVHRLGDKMDSHENTFTPSFCASASGNVFAG